jgi:hypothetical protein
VRLLTDPPPEYDESSAVKIWFFGLGGSILVDGTVRSCILDMFYWLGFDDVVRVRSFVLVRVCSFLFRRYGSDVNLLC